MTSSRSPHACEPASLPVEIPTDPPHRILVVEDDSDLRQFYAEALAGPGYLVDVAEDGAAGWEALQANCYHLMITDHGMPKLTGIELVKKLRGARMALPVVMAAGKLPSPELARNPSLQLAATLLKPFTLDALLDTVRKVLRATDAAREQIELLQVPGNASLQPTVLGCEDLNLHAGIQLTIDYPDMVSGEDVKISHR